MKNESRGNWIPTRDTALAKQVGARQAGILLSQAGFARQKIWIKAEQAPVHHTELRAKDLTQSEVMDRILEADATPAVKKALTAPTYQDLVKALEDANHLIGELRDEIRQLRSFQPNSGMGDRARKALAGAKRTLEIYGG